MRRLQRLTLGVPVALVAMASFGLAGCAEQAAVHVATPLPAPPPPPPPDQDHDGIIDADDKCPTEPEDGQPPDPHDGCPNKDLDKDGIPIPDDKCPEQPETVNGFQDEDGCPDEKPIVELKEAEVQINQKIQFEKDKAGIELGSLVVIDAVAELLWKNPDVELLEIGGHASKEGSEQHNRALTQKRVESVAKALVERGVEKDRLLAQGYGSYCPIDPGTTEEALEHNRRVEFKILYRDGKDLEQKRGCEEAEKHGVRPKSLPPLKPPAAVTGSPPAQGTRAPMTPATPRAPGE